MSGEKTLFLLDAMALIYRAHFAFIKNPRINSKGLNTSAIFGFTNSLLEILEKEKPTHIAVVTDPDTPTFRHEIYEPYKATREKMPEDIAHAKPYIEQLIKSMNIPLLSVDGYEADDVIGTLAKQAAKEGFKVYMMTPDKDFCQLVDDLIYIYKPARMGNKAEKLDKAGVLENWEIEHIDQVRDILGLMGDSSDNVPGVPKVGEKTAKKLIKDYKSIENLLEHADELTGKLKENLINFKNQALLSKKLVTIMTDAPVRFDAEKFKVEKPDETSLKELFRELEFKTTAKRIFGEDLILGDDNTETSETAENTYKTLKNTDTEYHLIETDKALSELIQKLEKSKSFTFDTETSGLNPHLCELIGISFSLKKGEAWYVPVPQEKNERESLLTKLRGVFENEKIEKTGQNIKYDILVMLWHGVKVKGKLFDTMIAHFLIDPETRHNMDVLSEKYLNYSPVSIESLIGKKGKSQKSMKELEPSEVSDYACEDADVTLQLSEILRKELKKHEAESLYDEIEGPLIRVLADMEKEGVKVDKQVLADFSVQLAGELEKLEKDIYERAGIKFNINSPKQLGEVLFVKLNLDPKAKRTRKSKQFATNEEILSRLANEHEIANVILEYRTLQKLKSTYVDALPELIHPQSGRIHTSYNQAITATGRLSSTNPNLQNIPIRTEKGRLIREAFIPRDEQHRFLAADYSQIELRLMADISGDEAMIEAFEKGLDIHAATAARVYGVSLEEVTSEMRRNAKTVNFGIIYGISAFGLSERLGIARKEAAEIIESYFNQYPAVKKYMEEIVEFAKENGYVQTRLGRKRFLRDINSRNHTTRGFAERNAINTPLQGTAAEMIKIAMIRIAEQIEKRNFKSKMILQVHDELIFDTHKDELEDFKNMVVEEMKNAMTLKVPVVVDAGFGSNWLEAH